MNKKWVRIFCVYGRVYDFTAEMTVSDEIFGRSADRYRRIRNTSRYLLANLNGFNPETDLVEVAEMVELDRWIVSRAASLQEELIKAYDEYQLLLGNAKLMNFAPESWLILSM